MPVSLSLIRQYRLARRERYVRLLEAGYSFAAAAREAGVRLDTARVWRNGKRRSNRKSEAPLIPGFYNSRMPAILDLDKKYNAKFLTLEERSKIHVLLSQGKSHRDIAKTLCRHHSCISREIAKNTDIDGNYMPYMAEKHFRRRLSRPKKTKVDKKAGLWIYILGKLELKWSPMQISKHLKKTHPNAPDMQLSAESIYRAVYVQGKGQLKEKLKKLMRRGRTGRKPRDKRGSLSKNRFIEPMVNISQRPAEANDRAVPGHWEGDLIMGKGNKSAIGTLVERSTRFCILLHLPRDHTADSVQKEIARKMRSLPEHLRKSLTWDQGGELALHRKISKELDMQVFFCDPHSPWQRGTNENTNGLLRQYFPKGTDLSVHSDEELDNAAAELNGRPRMTLGWKNPAQKFLEFQDGFCK